MRLSNLNEQLADAFSNAPDARTLFEQVFWRSYDTFEPKVKEELEANAMLSCLRQHKIPSSDDLAAMSESFDTRYFDLEDEGDFEASGNYFQKARITAAMAQASIANSSLDFAESAYEALMACNDPDLLSAALVHEIKAS